MSFYHLPHPWDPQFVIPDYVMAEPPERGTFTTQWLPRGTISQVIPNYLAVPQRRGSTLAKPSLAGGCFDNNSLTGSSLAGDSLGLSYELEPLGGSAKAWDARVSKYGKRVARSLVSKMRSIPEGMRASTMKKTMAAIDPTLQRRAEKYALEAKKRGLPAPAALEHGIARAMSEGAVGELTKLGRGRGSRRLAQSRSPRGLGRSRTALGLTAAPMTGPVATATSVPPNPGECSADGQYMWTVGTDGVGYWRRLSTGETCTTFYGGAGPAPTTVHESGEQSQVAPTLEMIKVGPWAFPKDAVGAQVNWHMGTPIPPEVAAAIKTALAVDIHSTSYNSWGWRLWPFIPDMPQDTESGFFNVYSGAVPDAIFIRDAKLYPIIKTKHPVSGKDYGIYLTVVYPYKDRPEYLGGTGGASSRLVNPDNPPSLVFSWAEILPFYRNWYERIWDKIMEFKAKVEDFIQDVRDIVHAAACEMLGKPGATEAAAQTANPYLVAGTVVAGAVCPKPPPPPPPPEGFGALLVPLLLVGGGLAAVMLVTRKH